MNINEKRERLHRYRILTASVAALRAQIGRIEQTARHAEGIAGDDDELRALRDEAQRLLRDGKRMLLLEIARCEAERRCLRQAVAKVADPRYRRILEYKYLCGLSDVQIALKMHYSVDRVHHLKPEALRAIELPETKGE